MFETIGCYVNIYRVSNTGRTIGGGIYYATREEAIAQTITGPFVWLNSRVRLKDYAPSQRGLDAEIEAQEVVYAQQIGRANRFLTPAEVMERHKADLAVEADAKKALGEWKAGNCEFCGAGPADKCRRTVCAFSPHIAED